MLGSHLMSASTGELSYKGSVTKEELSANGWDSPAEALDVLSIASVGDLVVIAFSFVANTSSFSWNGMSFIDIYDGTASKDPGYYIGYRFVQSGDTNPYISGATSRFDGLSVVASVFGSVSAFENKANASGINSPPNSPLLRASNGELWVLTAHAKEPEDTDWSAPTNYTLAASASIASVFGSDSSTAIAYRIESLSSDDPSAFGGTGDPDSWYATTIAFS